LLKLLSFDIPAGIGVKRMSPNRMAKSSKLSYDPPFRYKRPGEDLQAVFGAQTGNPRVVTVEKAKAGKQSTVAKKGPSAAAGKSSKASKPKASKPAASKGAGSGKAKAKVKKPAGKR
jgi:hypothetical protein